MLRSVLASSTILLIRLLVGTVFLSEGVQKFLFPESLGVGRFTKIGISVPGLMAPLVSAVEVVFGTCIAVGFLTRLSAIPLSFVVFVAIGTTKVPMLSEKGFWAAAHESRTDVSMLLGLLFLLIAGAGPWSVDARVSRLPS